MKNLLFKFHRYMHWHNRAVVLLVCIFIIFLYSNGKRYGIYNSMYPHEILDIQNPVLPFCSLDKEVIFPESSDSNYFISSINIEIFSNCRNFLTKASPFFLESEYLKDFERRLLILQRYNSWDSITRSFCFLNSI